MKQVSTQMPGILEFRQDIQAQLRARIREAIQITLEEELSEALGCSRYERNGQRRGYRNGSQTRQVTTAQGLQELDIPRGRIVDDNGNTREFRSAILPRYARRARQVAEAILGAYLAGANTRRIRKVLSPLVGKSPPVQEHDLEGGGAPEGPLRAMAAAGSVQRALCDPVPGRVPPESEAGETGRVGAGAGGTRGPA